VKKVNISVKKLPQFPGKWVAIKDERIIAVADKLKDLRELVGGTRKYPPKASAFKVPYKGEGPYVL